MEEKTKKLLDKAIDSLSKARGVLLNEVDYYLLDVEARLDDLKELGK